MLYNNSQTKTVTPKYTDTALLLNQRGIELSYTEDGKQVKTILPIMVVQKVPTKLSVKLPPKKVSYIEKQVFDSSGMILEVTYNDGEVKETTDFAADKTKLTYTDTAVRFTHRYNGKTASVSQAIMVRKQLPTSVKFTTSPDKTDYIEEEVFDPTGLTVTVKYDNGTENVLTPDYPKEEVILGQAEVILSYSENGATVTIPQPITVRKRLPTSIVVTTPPTKVAYIEEEKFDATGMVVTAHYDNGKSYVVTPTFPDEEVVFGQTKVVLSYSENGATVTVSQPITVQKRLPTSIVVTTPPTKVAYIEEEKFDAAGMVVTAHYDNGKSYVVTPTFPDEEVVFGQTKVVLSYSENGATVTVPQPITVRKRLPTSIVITTPPTKVAYIEEEKFDAAGMVVTAHYDNGKSYVVTPTFPDEELVFGQTEVVLSQAENGATVTIPQPITVRKRLPTSIVVTTPPTKVAYIEEEKFDATGMVVTAHYDNGKSYVVTPTFPDEELVFGQTEVVLSHSENGATVTVSQPITVQKRLPVKLEVTTPPTKTAYIEEEVFNTAGMVVTATFDSGLTHVVTPTITDKVIVLGQTSVTLTYTENGKTVTVTLPITSRKRLPTSLKINTPPSNTNYIEDERFNPIGTSFNVRYDNGKEAKVTPTYPNIPLVAGQTQITFSYTESGVTVTVKQSISVRRKQPTALLVTRQPNVTSYTHGLKFKPAGMIVKVDYGGGRTETTSGYTYSTSRLTQGQSYVRLSYTEQGKTVTADVPISVGAQAAVYNKYTCVTAQCSNCSGSGQAEVLDECPRCRRTTISCKNCGTPDYKEYCATVYKCNDVDCKRGWTSVTQSSCPYCGSLNFNILMYVSCQQETCSGCKGLGSVYLKQKCSPCSGIGKTETRGTHITVVEATYGDLPSNEQYSDGYWYVFVRLIQD